MAVNKKSLENLKPFKKGDPRNKELGAKSKRPPTFKQMIEKIFEEQKKKKGKLTLENYIQSLIVNAFKGNATAMKEINDRYYGKIKEEIKIESENSTVLTFQEIAAKKTKK